MPYIDSFDFKKKSSKLRFLFVLVWNVQMFFFFRAIKRNHKKIMGSYKSLIFIWNVCKIFFLTHFLSKNISWPWDFWWLRKTRTDRQTRFMFYKYRLWNSSCHYHCPTCMLFLDLLICYHSHYKEWHPFLPQSVADYQIWSWTTWSSLYEVWQLAGNWE